MVWIQVLMSVSLAAPPTRAPAVFEATGGATIRGLHVSSDQRVVVGVGGGEATVLDVTSWLSERTNLSSDEVENGLCTASSAAVHPRDDDSYYVFVGCEEGTIHTWRWINDKFRRQGGESIWDGYVFEVDDRPIVGLWPREDGNLYILEESDNTLRASRASFDDNGELTGDAEYAVSGTFHQGFLEAVPLYSDGSDANGRVVVAHGGTEFSTWTLESGLVQINALTPVSVDPDDIAPREGAGVYFVENDQGRVGVYNGSVQTSIQTVATGFGSPTAIVRSVGDDSAYWVMQDAGRIESWEDFNLSEPAEEFRVDFTAVDMVQTLTGWFVAGTDDGQFAVLTANPWVDDLQLSPNTGLSGTEVTVTFTPDTDGTWRLYQGGDYTGTGRSLADGSATAGEEVTTTFTVDEDFGEGEHQIWAVVTQGSSALKGHARALFDVDNPPEGIRLTDRNVGFADSALVLEFYKLAAADIQSYRVYLSKTPFSPDDWTTGGPEGDVDGVSSPVEIEQPENGATVTGRIEPLANYQTYYLAVRAWDGTTEGPMSDVVEGMPRPTYGASEIAGDAGGPPCSTAPGSWLGWSVLAGVGLLVRRRRTGVLAAALAALALTSGTAQAQEAPRPRSGFTGIFEADQTAAWGNFEFQYGSFSFRDPALQQVYGNSAGVFDLQLGFQIFRYFEADLGIGLLQKKGNTLDDAGSTSAEEIRLQWLPLQVIGTARVHVIDEQPVVPYGSIAFDYIWWRETPLDEEGAARPDERITGSKYGWHWAVGGNILLDLFAPRRASQLEATTGVNDTWLTIEYRQQRIGDGTGLDLSGWSISGGLKLDF